MTEKLYRDADDLELDGLVPTRPIAPGRIPATARVARASNSTLVLRVADADAARVLAGALGPRDDNNVAGGADAIVERAASTSGDALPSDVRARFESSLGADLSSVRVHTGDSSAAAAGAVGAHAYTVGQDIHFAEGKYAPHDPFGLHLLAHEVAHTVQQSGGAARRQHKLEVSTPGDSFEVEADRAADAMVAGQAAEVTGAPTLAARDDAPKADAAKSESDKVGSKEKKFPVGMDGFTFSLGKNSAIKVPWPTNQKTIEWAGSVKDGVKKEVKQQKAFPAGALPGGLSLSAEAAADLTATASASVKGGLVDLPPPFVDDQGAEVTVSGGADLTAKASGLVGAGVYVGIPPLNIGAEGYLTLEGSASAGAKLSGTARYQANGGWSGNVTFTVPLELTVKGTGGIRLIYNALVKSGELQKFELVSKDLFKAAINCVLVCDCATGTVSDQTTTTLTWLALDFPKAALTPEEKAQYQKQAEKEKKDRDGGSGSGPGIPPEAVDDKDR